MQVELETILDRVAEEVLGAVRQPAGDSLPGFGVDHEAPFSGGIRSVRDGRRWDRLPHRFRQLGQHGLLPETWNSRILPPEEVFYQNAPVHGRSFSGILISLVSY